MTESGFRSDLQKQHSILFNFIQVGENATAILAKHSDFAEAHPELPWFLMNGMRNRIVHGYRNLNLGVVWQTAVQEAPKLSGQLKKILDELGA